MTQHRYIHRPCVWIAMALGLGIWLGTKTHFGWPILALAGIFLCAVAFLTRHLRWGNWFIHAVFVVLGFVCISNAQILPSSHVAHLTYQERSALTAVEGVIVSDPDVRQTARGEKTIFELAVKRVENNGVWSYRTGKVLVNIFRKEAFRYGDRIRVKGKMHKPFDGGSLGHFSYDDYLKRNGIYWLLSVKKSSPVEIIAHDQGGRLTASLLNCRHRLQQVLDKHLNVFEAGVVQSLVLGGRYYIPERTRELFVQTGTAHILAISGMNVGGMAFLIFLLLNVLRVPRRAQIFLTCLILIVYCLLTGANPSVVRATVMAVVMLGGLLLEQETDTLNSLGLSAVIILLLDPFSLFDIGFQLSFMGVFSIIYFYPKIYRIVAGLAQNKVTTVLVQSLCVSLAAWIGVLPLIGYYFQIITPGSILANIPIIPFVSALFMLGCGLIMVGLLCPPLAFLFAACIKVVLFMLMMIVDVFSKLPGGYFYVTEVNVYVILIYYVVIGLIFSRLACFTHDVQAGKNLHFLS